MITEVWGPGFIRATKFIYCSRDAGEMRRIPLGRNVSGKDPKSLGNLIHNSRNPQDGIWNEKVES
jgi:hypothetical protein